MSRLLLVLYPPAWRRRYGDEFQALLAQMQPTPKILIDVVLAAWDAHWNLRPADLDEDGWSEIVPAGDVSSAIAGSLLVGTVLTVVAVPVGVALGAISV